MLSFWLFTFAAVPVALLVPPGAVRWTAIVWLGLVGVINALANWANIWLRRGSMVPLVGLSLAVALCAVPTSVCGRWILLGALLDPWIPATVLWGIACGVGVRFDQRRDE